MTEDCDYFNQQVLAYGFSGVSLTTTGSFQMEMAEFIQSGENVLRKLSLSLPKSFLLSHNNIRTWYCSHCVILGDCFILLKEYQESKKWYEAALVSFGSGYTEFVSHDANPDSKTPKSYVAGSIQDSKLKSTAADIWSHIAQMYHKFASKNEEAASYWYNAAKLYDDLPKKESAQAKGDDALESLINSGDADNAWNVIKDHLSSNLDSMRAAKLLTFRGRIQAFKRDFNNSIQSFNEAKRLYEEKECLKDPTMTTINFYLLLAYSREHEYRAALDVVKNFEYIIDMYHKNTIWWFLWKAHKANIYVDLGELETATLIMDQVVIPEGKNWNRLEAFVASVKAKLYLCENPRETDIAEEQYDTVEEFLKEADTPLSEHELERVSTTRKLYLNIGNWDEEDLLKMYHLFKTRVDSLRSKNGEENELARALYGQAVALGKILTSPQKWDRFQNSEVHDLIDEATKLVETRDHRFLAVLKYAKTVFSLDSGEPEVHEAGLLLAELQLKLKDLKSAWISFHGLEMAEVCNSNQYNLLVHSKGESKKSLLLVERGRQRLFMHLTKQHGDTVAHPNVEKSLDEIVAPKDSEPHDEDRMRDTASSKSIEPINEKQFCHRSLHQKPSEGVSSKAVDGIHENTGSSDVDELWFDRNDALAEKILVDAVRQSDALILEYTVWELMPENFIIYAVFINSEKKLEVKHEIVSIKEFYSVYPKNGKEWVWGETLKDLIDKTREFIKAKKDTRALEGLIMLHYLLIEPVRDHVKKFQRLIIAVHDDLARVPFAALYNKKERKYLVQAKILSYVPSIRVLQYCYQQQRAFERNMQQDLLDPPFIAGISGALRGWRLKELQYAREEAECLAKMLGVQPHMGLDLNKDAVKRALSKASIVHLATHALVNAFYPHGAVILKDRTASSSDLNGSSLSDAEISADEIASLDGGIRAGLVVLSACETAMGEITKEGLLGLGRSILLGGAPTAILTLWEVDDFSNKVLIEGLFQQFVKNDKDIAESLQSTMQSMINAKNTIGKKKYAICHWAPLVVLGSPLLKLKDTTLYAE